MNNVVVTDRVTGSAVAVDDRAFTNGRFIEPTGGEGGGSILLADRMGRWSTSASGSGTGGQVSADLLPSRLVRSALHSIALDVGRSKGDHLTISPLLPPGARMIELLDVDLSIAEALPLLGAAIERPYERLRQVPEPVAIGRARRIDRGASAYLAAHSEDWGRLTRAGVQPTRILATLTDRNLKIYENSVLVTAVDTALKHVWARVSETDELQGFFNVLADTLEAVEGFGWRAAESMYTILGEAYAGFDRDRAQEVGVELERLRRHLGAMKGSPTARAVPLLGTRGLHLTNLLRDDHRYRVATDLLLEMRDRRQAVESDEPADLDPVGDQVAFVLLLLLRSLAALGSRQLAGAATRGATLSMTGGWLVEWTLDDRLFLSFSGELAVVIVPVPQALENPESSDAVADLLNADCGDVPTLVTYLPAGATDAPEAPWQTDALAHEQKGRAAPGIIPLSPLDARSSLRVDRVVRWIESRRTFLGYAQEHELRPSTVKRMSEVAGSWIRSVDGTTIALTREPKKHEIAELKRAMEPADRGYRRTHDLVDPWATLEQIIERSRSAIESARACPVCHAVTLRFDPRGGRCFWCQCLECGAEWGLRECEAGHRTPVLVPAGVQAPVHWSSGWVVSTFGPHALARPCERDVIGGFVCPTCRTCSSASLEKSDCARCSH